jgi:hypothetical protein
MIATDHRSLPSFFVIIFASLDLLAFYLLNKQNLHGIDWKKDIVDFNAPKEFGTYAKMVEIHRSDSKYT